MTRPVSLVLPSLGTLELFEDNLPSVFAEVEARGLGDEVIVVDDTGNDELAAWLKERFPSVQTVVRDENGGFARALFSGVERARHELVFSLNTDVRVRLGFLDPLVACIDEDDVAAVVPRVLLEGDQDRIESLTEIGMREGLVEISQPGLNASDVTQPFHPVPVAFAVGGTCLFRRDEFLSEGGFDDLFLPFYWEDVDYCWNAWRQGRRVLYQPASTVEHHHRGTIGKIVPREVVRGAIEKNRILFQWKHLDDPESLRRHVAALYRMAIDAWVGDLRRELVWLNLALEQLDEALAARESSSNASRSFGEIRDLTRPVGGSDDGQGGILRV